MAEVDLHLHTTFSDGRLKPAQLIDLLVSRGLRIVSVTDHDTTEGIDQVLEAAQAYPQLMVIPGTEISTDVPQGEVHLLAYYIDLDNQEFQDALARFRESRIDRAKKMVQKLADLGMPVQWERVQQLAKDGSIGRPHIAQALVEKGYLATTQEAVAKYLGRNCPAYVEREKLTPEDAVRMAVQAGGLPVLAHPGDIEDLDQTLTSLKAAGLVGMEVYYGNYPPEQMAELAAIARRHNLIPCGGSDYHAMGYAGEVEPGTVGPPAESAYRLLALKQAQTRHAIR